MSSSPEAGGAVYPSVLTTEALEVAQPVPLDQERLVELSRRIMNAMPSVVSAAVEGDFCEDGSIMGGGDVTVKDGRVVSVLQTFYFPVPRRSAFGPWRCLGRAVERLTIDEELGDLLTTRDYRLMWNGNEEYDLVLQDDEKGVASGATPEDLERLLGYFKKED